MREDKNLTFPKFIFPFTTVKTYIMLFFIKLYNVVNN